MKAIPTDIYWDKAANEAFPNWRKNFEQWQKLGSDFPYHYLGSTITFTRIGRAFGKTMIELRKAHAGYQTQTTGGRARLENRARQQ